MNNTLLYMLIATLWSAGIAGIVSFYWVSRFRKEVIQRIEILHTEFIKKRSSNESIKSLADDIYGVARSVVERTKDCG